LKDVEKLHYLKEASSLANKWNWKLQRSVGKQTKVINKNDLQHSINGNLLSDCFCLEKKSIRGNGAPM
jgi:hypothetical protein